jgi:hypothetical protein
MELSFSSYLNILRLNIIKIIFISFFISVFSSYFFNLDKVLGTLHLEIEIPQTQNSKVFENLNFKTSIAQKSKNEALLLVSNFDSFNFNKVQNFTKDLKLSLEKNEIISNNFQKTFVENNGLKYSIKNIYFNDKIEREIVSEVNREYQNYQYIMLKQFKDINFNLLRSEILQKIKKRQDEYASIKNNLSQVRKTQLICFINCFEVSQKNDVTILEKNDEDYFYLENKELNSLYDTLKIIDINVVEKKIAINISFAPEAPIFTRFQIFSFIFLIMVSLSAIFFLLKENLDEKYRKD